jgi:hypothetical protein
MMNLKLLVFNKEMGLMKKQLFGNVKQWVVKNLVFVQKEIFYIEEIYLQILKKVL